MPYIGRSTDGFGVRNRFLYLASASDTSVSGADANGATLTFTDGAYVDVYLNGVLLKAGTDYNTNTANTIAGISSMSANDEVTVIVYDIFAVADTVSQSSGGTFTGGVTFNGAVEFASGFTASDGSTITVDDNSDNLTLTSTDADANGGPNLRLYRNSSSPADGDMIGQIDFEGRNDNSQDIVAASIRSVVDDVSDGTEDSRLIFETLTGGSAIEPLRFKPGETVFNEGSADIDFRVEGNGDANALFVEGETDKVGIGNNDPADKLHVYEPSGQRVARFEANNSTSAFIAFKASNTSLSPAIGVKDEDMFFSIGDAVEKMRLNSSGYLKVNGSHTGNYYGGNAGLYHDFTTNQSNELCFNVTSFHSSYSSRLSQFNIPASDSTSNAKFISCYSSNPGGSADLEYYVRVDGQVYADGNFNSGGADYAEFFEWKDGNTSDENRVGYSVVLDGNKIRKATSSDNTSNIIGVISVNPSVVGDADGEYWQGTYLKDDFGKYIFKDSEQVEWTVKEDRGGTNKEDVKYSFQKDYIPSDVTVPSDAKKIPIKVRTLNPDYDKSKTYERREDRKEWSYVGMMGKLRMLKGQPTGDRWIKMRDISDTVEEWLVR